MNKAIIPSSYLLPTFEELSAKLHSSKYFSKVDMRWGFLQVPLAKEFLYLTAFITADAVYQYKRVCFGMTSALVAFKKIVAEILHGTPGCFNLLDNAIVTLVLLLLNTMNVCMLYWKDLWKMVFCNNL